jgi:CBS domain-containing protein
MPANSTVRDLYTPIADYPHVRENATLRDVFATTEASRLWAEQFRSVLVLNEMDDLVGVLSLRDMLQALLPDYLRNVPAHLQWISDDVTPLSLLWQGYFAGHIRMAASASVSTFITPVKEAVSLDTPLAKAVYLMTTTAANVLPVTDNGRIIGVLRLVDVVAEVSKVILHE